MNKHICALATPMGKGGIAVIRISGNGHFKKIEPFFSGKKLSRAKANQVFFGKFSKQNGSFIDDVLISVFKNPKSYTGEDVLEISCHNNRLIIEAILTTLNSVKISLAEPGEFTKRAFLNGKLDLTQAEAVADLIHANSDKSLLNAQQIFDGKLGKIVKAMREQMIKTAGLLEIDLDFSEEDLNIVDKEIIKKYIRQNILTMTSFLKKSNEMRFINEGVKLSIVGKPNAGKSSLLNAILGKDRAIVSEIPGTTRDSIEENIHLSGLLFRLIDTAGIRETSDTIEKIGVEIAYSSIDKSDCVLLIIDSTLGLTKEDLAIEEYAHRNNKKIIRVFNKIDLSRINETDLNVAYISAKKEIGLEKLIERILSLYQTSALEQDEELVVSNLRHELAIRSAIGKLEHALSALENNFGNEMISFDIRQAIEELSKVTGDITNNDILNDIFANFCIGK